MRKNPRLSNFFLLCMLTLYCQSFSWAKVKNLNDSVVVAWPFEGNFNDISGNGYQGKLLGKTKFGTGKFGQSIALSGKGDGIITPKLEAMDEVTVAHWSKCTGRFGA